MVIWLVFFDGINPYFTVDGLRWYTENKQSYLNQLYTNWHIVEQNFPLAFIETHRLKAKQHVCDRIPKLERKYMKVWVSDVNQSIVNALLGMHVKPHKIY